MSVVTAKNLNSWNPGVKISSTQMREEFLNIYDAFAGNLDDSNVAGLSIGKVTGLQDVLNSINTSIANGADTYLALTGGTLTGNLVLGTGAEALQLKPGTADHVYLGLYARSSTSSVRSGYVGYPATASKTLDVRNELNDKDGHVDISTVHASAEVRAKGSRVLTRDDLKYLYHVSTSGATSMPTIVHLPTGWRIRVLTMRATDTASLNGIDIPIVGGTQFAIHTVTGTYFDAAPVDVFFNNTSGTLRDLSVSLGVSNSGSGNASFLLEPIPA